ncbi:NlpC/P60 family protein [Streptomyces sp. NPDC057245]|uniref:C40 family peptidase n=1 Tax=Streptomyces sp. NPDC057245 TaxID=3346065 RepID=UPI003640F312
MRRIPRARGHRRTAATAALTLSLTAALHQPVAAEPQTLSEVRAEIELLHHDAEVATDRYNAVDQEVTRQTRQVRSLGARIRRTERDLNRLVPLAGAAARAQYRGGGLPAEVQFALAPDPAHALDAAARTRQAQHTTNRVVTTLAALRHRLRTLTDDESAELSRLRENRRALAAHRRTVEKRIDKARKLESRLAEDERRRLAELDAAAGDAAHAQWVSTGILKHLGTEAGAAGKKAIEYATRQLGKPYVWGAEGPDSFDCSGLTSQAWRSAGITVPRTSQDQWRLLEHVPVEEMRPGDLIIYHPDASHVGLYTGDGNMIHAPRPGRSVTVAPAGSMVILGVVRPDA